MGTWLLTAPALVAASYLLLALPGWQVDALVVEDGPVEMLGAAGLLLAAGLFARGALRAYRHPGFREQALGFVALSLLFFVGAAEEVSWGQRWWGWQTPPELAQVNVQGETNLHNLAALSGGLDAGRLFNLFTFGFVLGLPLLRLVWPAAMRRVERWGPVPPLALALPFVMNQLASKVADPLLSARYSGRFDFIQCVTEIKETNLALLFVSVACVLLRAISPPEGRAAPGSAPLHLE